MEFLEKVRQLDDLLQKHHTFREDCLNMIASENLPSPLVDRLLSLDLNHRYGNYSGIDLRRRSYQGNRFIVEIEELAQDLAGQLFGAAYVDLRPLSGNIAGIATTFCTGQPGRYGAGGTQRAPLRFQARFFTVPGGFDLGADPLGWTTVQY